MISASTSHYVPLGCSRVIHGICEKFRWAANVSALDLSYLRVSHEVL